MVKTLPMPPLDLLEPLLDLLELLLDLLEPLLEVPVPLPLMVRMAASALG